MFMAFSVFSLCLSERFGPRVIARRSRSKNGVASLAYGDEAIQRARSAPTKNAAIAATSAFSCAPAGAQLDCFASLAMTVGVLIVLSLRMMKGVQPLVHACLGVLRLGHVADHGDGIGAGLENLARVFELDAADRHQRRGADPLLPFGDARDALRAEAHRLQRGREDRSERDV